MKIGTTATVIRGVSESLSQCPYRALTGHGTWTLPEPLEAQQLSFSMSRKGASGKAFPIHPLTQFR